MIIENAKVEDIALLTEYFERNLNQNLFCYLIRDKEEIASCWFYR